MFDDMFKWGIVFFAFFILYKVGKYFVGLYRRKKFVERVKGDDFPFWFKWGFR